MYKNQKGRLIHMQTIRAGVELPRVNKQFDWKVMTTLTSPSQNPAKWRDFISYERKEFGDNVTHLYVPRSFVSITIGPYGAMKEVPYAERWIMLDVKSLFRFRNTLQKIYEEFQIKDLYYYDNGVLKLDQELAKDKMQKVITNGKTLMISYAIIKDEDNGGDFEGIVIFVNNYSVYMTLTHFELGFMLQEIEKLNLTQIGFDLIRASLK